MKAVVAMKVANVVARKVGQKLALNMAKGSLELFMPRKRWDKSMDTTLFMEVVDNVLTPSQTKGITISRDVHSVGISGVVGIVGDVQDYTVETVYNPYALIMARSAFALCYCSHYDKRAVIIVDDRYMTLDNSTKEFILQHELGHICFKHDGIFVDGKRLLVPEYQADDYACNKVGKDVVLNGLLTLNSKMQGFIYKASREELDRRIKMINKRPKNAR